MSKNVLLIEDNEQNIYLMVFLLEKHGYQVTVAKDGPAGLAASKAAIPDIVLLDIQLPGMDGYEVAETLRQDRGMDAVPIICVSSFAMTGDRERGLAAGCDGYVTKPIDPSLFVSQITPFLEHGREVP